MFGNHNQTTYSHSGGSIDKEDGDEDDLEDDAEAIYGRDDDTVGLQDPVVSPEVGVQQLEHVRDALELLGRSPLHDVPKRFPTKETDQEERDFISASIWTSRSRHEKVEQRIRSS